MKNIKSLLVFLCMGAAFAACSDDENINVGDTTVQFQSASMLISEVTTALDIPIEVTGSHEGTVKVSVQYIESNGLKDDSNVIITSRELLIPAGVSTVDLETRLSVANDEMEEGRVLTFKIVDVVGATLGSNATCEVSLKEASPIEGSYALTGLDLATGAVGSILCTLTLSETDANTLLLDFGMGATVPVQLYPGDKEGRGGIYNFVTKRGICRENARLSWTQVETGSAITWKYPSCILAGDNSVGEFYSVAMTNHFQQADTGTKMIHLGRNTRSRIVSKGISAGRSQNSYRGLVRVAKAADNARNYSQCDSLLIGDKCGAHTFPVIDSRNLTAVVEHEATTSKISEDQLFYCNQRGLSTEEAVGLIVNGYAKEVLNKLPMEFAVEAQKLLAISLEGSVG